MKETILAIEVLSPLNEAWAASTPCGECIMEKCKAGATGRGGLQLIEQLGCAEHLETRELHALPSGIDAGLRREMTFED